MGTNQRSASSYKQTQIGSHAGQPSSNSTFIFSWRNALRRMRSFANGFRRARRPGSWCRTGPMSATLTARAISGTSAAPQAITTIPWRCVYAERARRSTRCPGGWTRQSPGSTRRRNHGRDQRTLTPFKVGSPDAHRWSWSRTSATSAWSAAFASWPSSWTPAIERRWSRPRVMAHWPAVPTTPSRSAAPIRRLWVEPRSRAPGPPEPAG